MMNKTDNSIGYTEGIRWRYKAISAYNEVDKPNEWLDCPNCGLKPLIWEFDNGRSTACGCGDNEYNHPSVHSESIMSIVTRNNGSSVNYDNDGLKKNWNHWVTNGEILFEHAGKRTDGKW